MDEHERRPRAGHLHMDELVADPQEAVLWLLAADFLERPQRGAAETGEQEGKQREEWRTAHGWGVYLPTGVTGAGTVIPGV